MIRISLITLTSLFLITHLTSQDINEHLCTDVSLDSSGNKKLFLGIENTDFIRNHEYFNDICDGYTLIGFGLSPTVSYYFTPRLKVEAGFYLLAYFGLPDYAALAQVWRVQ